MKVKLKTLTGEVHEVNVQDITATIKDVKVTLRIVSLQSKVSDPATNYGPKIKSGHLFNSSTFSVQSMVARKGGIILERKRKFL